MLRPNNLDLTQPTEEWLFSMGDKHPAINRAVKYSTNVLTHIRDALGVKGLGEDICVVALVVWTDGGFRRVGC